MLKRLLFVLIVLCIAVPVLPVLAGEGCQTEARAEEADAEVAAEAAPETMTVTGTLMIKQNKKGMNIYMVKALEGKKKTSLGAEKKVIQANADVANLDGKTVTVEYIGKEVEKKGKKRMLVKKILSIKEVEGGTEADDEGESEEEPERGPDT